MVNFRSSSKAHNLLLLYLLPASLAFSPAAPIHSFVSAAQPTSTSTTLCSSASNTAPAIPMWAQHEISITAPSRGCHLITSEVNKAIQKDISGMKIGMANLFIQHTSASLTINENADPDVRRDMEVAMNKICPGEWTKDGTFHHTMEGEDDMPGHVKSSLMGVSLNIPIRNGRLALGTWQGIYLNEHRDQGAGEVVIPVESLSHCKGKVRHVVYIVNDYDMMYRKICDRNEHINTIAVDIIYQCENAI